MNYINKIRACIAKELNEKAFQKGDFEVFYSPSEQFRLNTTTFWSDESNWHFTKVEIYDCNRNKKLFDFFVNDDRLFHGWFTKNNTDYLICAEDIYGGQTVVDLTNRQLASYSPNEDGFIWTDFHLSPDGKTLATMGCYWACPYVIKLFDFTDPMNLPLPETREIELLANDEAILGWLDNETIQMKVVKREYEPEYSETNMERTININT